MMKFMKRKQNKSAIFEQFLVFYFHRHVFTSMVHEKLCIALFYLMTLLPDQMPGMRGHGSN